MSNQPSNFLEEPGYYWVWKTGLEHQAEIVEIYLRHGVRYGLYHGVEQEYRVGDISDEWNFEGPIVRGKCTQTIGNLHIEDVVTDISPGRTSVRPKDADGDNYPEGDIQ